MEKKYWLDVLGIKLKEAIKKYHYPDLEPEFFADESGDEVREVLQDVSEDNEELRKLLLKMLMRGRIEEIEPEGEDLVFFVETSYKGYRYWIQLKLQGIDWRFRSIEQIGKSKEQSYIWGVSTAVVFLLLIGTVIAVTNSGSEQRAATAISGVDANEGNEAVGADDADEDTTSTDALGESDGEADTGIAADELSVEELQSFAEENGYVLHTVEQFQQTVDQHVDEAIADQIEEIEARAEQTALEQLKAEQDENDDENGAEDTPEDTVEITIDPGMSVNDIGNLLTDVGVIRSSREIEQIISSLQVESDIRSGTYEIEPDMTYMEIINVLRGI
jgi:hypothetical protein